MARGILTATINSEVGISLSSEVMTSFSTVPVLVPRYRIVNSPTVSERTVVNLKVKV